ncbi:TIGR00282 family metallophosphoesterase [Halalkalibacillus sediminis]|uniref:TIGR00282 family metallophosphoesterase n=1 Tax=Halalkalibacillus sediminis TaxID=2018042 RepID=A0A2I0QX59_9BACI|nr:TIGR00282 family metallophosphoesterase [Halalkalibacillus sediminis]PKR78690.1 TIGR00282 family metallophosphoesterase [Halalkalibacillus sediminis]
MNILFIGDIVGKPGRQALQDNLASLKKDYHADLTIVNGENAAHGKGLTKKIFNQILEWGGDIVTLGNHAWDKKEIFEFIDDTDKLVRPANFPEGTPGKGLQFIKAKNKTVAVINLQGRTFMNPIDDPFQIIDDLITEAKKKTNHIFVDFHAEATSEKQAMGWYLDGRASAVVGTHTHIQTSDERILTNGTAYITDVGMTGPYDSILGVEKEAVIRRFKTALPVKFEVPETERTVLSGIVVTLDDQTGIAKKVKRILINDDHMRFH